MKALVGIFAASVMLVSAPAMSKEPGWYIGAGAGSTKFKTNEGFSEEGLGLALLGGYQVNPYFAWEGELNYSGEAKGTATVNNTEVLTRAHYTNWAVGVVGMIPFEQRFAVFGRAQAAYGQFEIDREPAGAPDQKTTSRDGGYILGVGASVQFGAADIRLRYDYQRFSFDESPEVGKPTRIGLDFLWRF